jgi:hypothetical protein
MKEKKKRNKMEKNIGSTNKYVINVYGMSEISTHKISQI